MEFILTVLASVIAAATTAFFTARLQKQRICEELKLEYSIETAILHLLENENYKKRSLKKIKRHLRGFANDDELRLAMVRSGAVAFGGEGDDELWGLLSRNSDEVK